MATDKQICFSLIDFLRKAFWAVVHLRTVVRAWRMRRSILSFSDKQAARYREEIAYIRQSGVGVLIYPTFPYHRVRYDDVCFKVLYDDHLHLPYVDHGKHRLYYPIEQSVERISSQYNAYVNFEGITGRSVLAKAPHSYVRDSFCVEEGDVLIDVGAAEALFTLHNIEKISRAYVFEAMAEWNRPLSATFAPWREKVFVINKFVGAESKGNCISLMDALASETDESQVFFIKMDIEGGERDVLAASRIFLQKHRVKLSCCVYHCYDDAQVLSEMLREIGFSVSFSDGYMIPLMGHVAPPYFRHGVLYAKNY